MFDINSFVCPKSKQELKIEDNLVVSHDEQYSFKDGILNLFYYESKLKKKEDDYDINFNLEVLYKSSKDLETRIKFLNSRFKHNLNCQGLVDYLNKTCGKVLEVGCGTMQPLLPVGNHYNESQQVWGIDISWALLWRARENFPRAYICRANAAHLPFRDNFFDLIWARHMLYHVEDANAILQECKRCLNDEGVFCLSTNGRLNKPQMHAFHKQVLEENGIIINSSARGSARFPAEEADERVRPFFKYVIKISYEGWLEFPNEEEFLDYYISTAYFKLAIKHGLLAEQLKETATAILKKNPVHRLSNNGAVVFATDSLLRFEEMSQFCNKRFLSP